MILLLALAAALFAVSMTGTKPHLFWGQTHHAYYGWALGLLTLLLDGPGWVFVLANVLAWDDAYQHFVQAYGGSPVHVAYGWVYHVSWLRSLNRWLDDL